ncbi:Molybdopterin molybdenumtransferase [Nymphon striatum]|nr:Molybdopterin molybdenumtransferase [Nymphon striatum]
MQAADLGLAASLGTAEVTVRRHLKVAFFSTGDELISVGKPLEEGQIYDSNRYTIYGMLSRLGVSITDYGVVPDDPEQLEATLLKAASDHDVVMTSGGVSVGEADYMKALLKKHGQVLFWKINMKPGRPLAYGKINNAHYFGLPGNPVSAMVTFYQFVRLALLSLMGNTPQPAPLFKVESTQAIKKAKGRTEFQRGVLLEEGGVWKVKPLPNQGSGILSSMSIANCFIVLAEEIGNCEPGTVVDKKPRQLIEIELQKPTPPAPVVEPLPAIDIPEPVKPKPPKPVKKKVKPIKPKPIKKKEAPLPIEPPAEITPPPVVEEVIAIEPTSQKAPEIVVPEPTPAPIEPPPPQPSQADRDNALNAYSNQLGRAIAKHKSYPKLAQRRGWQGTVLLNIKVDGNGNVLSAVVSKSSGHNSLDKRALKMVEKASPFPAPPTLLQGDSFNISVPVVFKLTDG